MAAELSGALRGLPEVAGPLCALATPALVSGSNSSWTAARSGERRVCRRGGRASEPGLPSSARPHSRNRRLDLLRGVFCPERPGPLPRAGLPCASVSRAPNLGRSEASRLALR